MLFGSQSPIISMCYIKNWTGDRDRIATLAENGLALSLSLVNIACTIYLSFSCRMVSLWDGKDGACLKYMKTHASQQTGLKVMIM